MGGGGSLAARTELGRVAAALENLSTDLFNPKTNEGQGGGGGGHVTFAGMDTGLSHSKGGGMSTATMHPCSAEKRRTPRSSHGGGAGGAGGGGAGGNITEHSRALEQMGARMQQQLETQLKMIENSQRQLEERHREEAARLEREMKAKAEEARVAHEAAQVSGLVTPHSRVSLDWLRGAITAAIK
jgi:hypothetical protein